MRKSPFSTPRGQQGGGGGWKSNNRRGNRGYDFQKCESFQMPPASPGQQGASGDDFIPFGSGSPSTSENHQSPNRYRGRGGRNRPFPNNPGYQNRNEHFSPRGRFNQSFSPFRSEGRSPRGRNKGFQNYPPRKIPISEWLDLESTLEDPWKRLIDEMFELSQEKKRQSDVSIDLSASNIEVHDSLLDDSELLLSQESLTKENEIVRSNPIYSEIEPSQD